MYKINFIAVITIVAAVSLAVVGMAAPAAFAANHENMTMNMGNNMSSMMNNMTGGGGGNATSMAETENITTANETGLPPLTTSHEDTAHISFLDN